MLRLLTTTLVLLGFSAPLLAQQVCPTNLPPLVTPDSRYSLAEPVPGEFVVTDLDTGLMWKQCPEGLSGAGCASGSLVNLTWSAALTTANASTHAGFGDWRLPNVTELYSLVEPGCFNPAINTQLFPNNGADNYWTSTTDLSPSNFRALVVTFRLGEVDVLGVKSGGNRVRLVRNGVANSFDNFDSAGDFTPDAFAFLSQSDVPLADLRTSNAITVSGIDTPMDIRLAGAADSTYAINGGPFVSAAGLVNNGDSVVLRHTSAATPASRVISVLSIGRVAATFDTTTAGNSPPQRHLNDTGQITCFNNIGVTGTVAPATPNPVAAGFENQDCVRGSAAADALGVLVKSGASSVPGRDYSKIANNGSELPASAALGSAPGDWACTRDNVTGLIWEVKVDDVAQLRHSGHSYTWFESDGNAGDPGSPGIGSSCAMLANCNTTTFRETVNNTGLCGASDWRMPTRQELLSLAQYAGSGFPVGADPVWYPNTAAGAYWTGATIAVFSNRAWSVVGGELSDSRQKVSAAHVRLVRGGL